MTMAHQSVISEFIERARTLCNTQSRNLRKEAENFFQASRNQNTASTYQVCVDILQHTVSAQEKACLSPEVLLAGQTLCWICKHKLVPWPQMQAVSELLVSLAARGNLAKYPLVVQITSAVSAALITTHMRVGSDADWSEAVVGSMFTIAAERGISSELWVTYILSILSTMPEVVTSKEVILLVCASSDITQSVAADASVLKNLLVAGELLKQTSTVECTAIQAVVFASSAGGVSADVIDLLRDVTRCCTQWVSFAAQILQARLPAATSLHSVVPTFLVALESVNLWHRSTLVNTAISYLKSSGANAGAGTEACLEMCAALCSAVDITTSSAVHPIEAHLCSLAQSIAMQLLPALSALLAMMCTRCNEAFMAHKVSSNGAAQVESALENCLLMTRTAAECATALLPRAFKPIFAYPGNTAVLSPELSAVVAVWVTFVNTFQETIYTIAHRAQELVQNSTESELVELVSAQRQQMLEVGLSFVSDLADATYLTDNAQTMDERAALTNTVNRAVEKVLVAAVQASAYSIQERINASVDEFDEFRNYVRDCLRLLVVSVPSLALWVVNHTVQSVSALSQQVRTKHNANQCGKIDEVNWHMAEALLHALTAITKHIQSHVRSSIDADLLHATFQLASLLTTDDLCSSCRPLSRMCVVLYAELAPIFLELLQRIAVTADNGAVVDKEVKIVSVVQVLRAMMLRLLLSLYHPEAPFNPQHPLPACIAVVQSVPNSCVFLLGSDRSSVNLDFLCLEGSFVPFRVKQDHIGAVSLQKAFAAVLTHIVQHPHSRATLGAVLCPNLGLWSQLPNIVELLKNTQHHESEEQNLSVCMQQSSFNISAANDSETKITPALLCLTLSALISHTLQNTEKQAMTYKSFQLQIQALNAGLLIPSNSADLTAQAVLQNVGAFSAPMSAAIAHILAHRRGDADAVHVRAYVSHCCRLLSGSDDDTCMHAVTELSQLLCTRCALAQLFSILSGLIHEMRLTCSKVASSLASVYYGALLCVIETCVPLLELLVHAAREKNLALTDLETEALGDFLSACSCIEYSATAVTAEPALCAVATSLLLRLQENYVSLLREATVGVKRQLLLPVALVVLKSVCTWSAVVNTTDLFHRTVDEVSTIGVQIAHDAAQQKSLPSQRITDGSSGKTRAEQNNAFFILLQFWNVCLSRTVLLPAVVSATTAITSKKGAKNISEEVAKLSFDALGWNSLDCILAQVCRNFESFCLDPSTEQLMNSFCHGHVDGWEAALKVLTLSLGPINIAMSANASVLDSDGKITPAALKDAKCKEEPAGEPELVNWLMQSGHAERISRALLYALLQSTSAPSASVSISSHTNEKQVRYFPSELRDDCIACLIKLVLCLGTARAGVSLNQALQHAQCPRNGVLGAQSASAAVKVCQWVEKLLTQGKAGDWKKFRSHAKMLCRG